MTQASYKGPVCRGSWSLGNNCKICERCIATKLVMTTDRIEQAAPDVREVLEAAWNTIHDHQVAPWRKLAVANGVGRFTRFLDAEAYTDAALMLVPEGLYPTIDFVNCRVWLRTADNYDVTTGTAYGFERTVPLSIAAAALRAKGPGHEQ